MFLEFAICKSRTWIKRIKEALSLWMRGFSIIIDAPTVLTVRYYYSSYIFFELYFFIYIFRHGGRKSSQQFSVPI